MLQELKRDGRYRLRKIAVESVFGQIKPARRSRQFPLHGRRNTQQ